MLVTVCVCVSLSDLFLAIFWLRWLSRVLAFLLDSVASLSGSAHISMDPSTALSAAAASFLDGLDDFDSDHDIPKVDGSLAGALAEPQPESVPAGPLPKQAAKIEVSEETLALLGGSNLTTYADIPLSSTFQQILAHPMAATPMSNLDDDTAALTKFFFDDQAPKLHASKQALGQILSISPDIIEPKLGCLAESLVVMERRSREQLEASIVATAPATKLLLYIDLTKYDETPMPITHRQRLTSGHPLPEELGGAVAGGPAAAATDQAPPGSTLKATTVSKMLSSQDLFACLVECQVESDTGLTKDYVSFIGNTLTWNQLIERNTGENLAAALSEGMSISEHSRSSP